MIQISVAVVKVGSSTPAASGDTLEVIERPDGGMSFVLVDAAGTGRGAKTLSKMLASRAITLLSDGGDDTAVARAVHDYLYSYRMGQVAATLDILTIGFATRTLRLVRNTSVPFFLITPDGVQHFAPAPDVLGLQPTITPSVTRLPVQPWHYLVLFTDGLVKAGQRFGRDLELVNYLAGFDPTLGAEPSVLCDDLLARALAAEENALGDDISLLVLAMRPLPTDQTAPTTVAARRLTVSVPLEPDA